MLLQHKLRNNQYRSGLLNMEEEYQLQLERIADLGITP